MATHGCTHLSGALSNCGLGQLGAELLPLTHFICHPLILCFLSLFQSPPVVHAPLFLLFPHRETVVRLQSENKMLCVQEETYRQTLVEVQAQLEEAQRSKNALETHNRSVCGTVCARVTCCSLGEV